jgi:hypothetical protein
LRPSNEEWDEFLGHFELRRLALGDCGGAYGSSCIRERGIRCSVHWPDPAQRDRVTESATTSPSASATPNAKAGPAKSKDSKSSLPGVEDKLAQMERRTPDQNTVHLGIPTLASGR